MMKKTLLILCAYSMIFFSCDKVADRSRALEPTSSLTRKSVVKKDYERVLGADIPMYWTQANDTVHIVTFDFDDVILSETWKIGIEDEDEKSIDKLLFRLGFLSPLDDECTHGKYIFNSSYNSVYRIKVDTVENNLSFTYHHHARNN